MPKYWEFEAFLYEFRKGMFYIDIPFDSQKEFGTRAAVRVYVWFENYKYRTSMAPKGDGTHWVYVKKEIREAIGKSDGDTVRVKLERDLDSREPLMPDDLKWLLDNEPETRAIFDKLPPSTKKQFIESVTSSKTENTRIKNINHIFTFLYKQKKAGQ
jgi:hypothetical protein